MSDDRSAAYAQILATVKLFAHLDRVALARIAGSVESISVDDGIAVCRDGDTIDSLYIVSRGTFAVFVAAASGPGEVRFETLSPGDYFGETCLIDEHTRAPSVRAEGAGELLRLPRARVVDLFRLEPATQRAIAGIVRRLMSRVAHGAAGERGAAPAPPAPVGGRDRGETQSRVVRALVMTELGQLGPERLARVLESSVLDEPSLSTLRVLFGDGAEEVRRDLADLGVRGGRPSGPALDVLRERFEGERGKAEVGDFAREAAARLVEARRWDDAMGVLARCGARAELVEVLGQALKAVPPLPSERASHWLSALTEAEAVQDAAVLLGKAALLESRGDLDAARRLLRLALAGGLAAKEPALGPQLAAELARLGAAGAGAGPGGRRAGGAAPARRRAAGTAFKVAVGSTLALLAVAAVLDPGHVQARFFLIFGAAIVLLIAEVLPDFAIGVLLIVAWIVFGLGKPAHALAGFASANWIFVVAILGLAAAIARSGLLFRVGLLLVRRMPAGLFWQAAALWLTGVILGPLLPQPPARAAVGASLALTVAEGLRLRDREPAASVLGLAAWLGGPPMLFVFLNGGPVCLLAWGLLPEQSRAEFTWLRWLLAAAPLGFFIGLGALSSLFILLRPHAPAGPLRERVNFQLAVLGPLSTRERVMIAVLVLTVAGWMTEPLTGLDPSVVALLALVATVVTGIFDRKALGELDWSYLIFYGVMLGLSGFVRSLGLDTLAARAAGALLRGLEPSPFVVLPLVACLSVVVRLALPTIPSLLVLAVAVVPLAPALGVHPWTLLIPLLATSSMWLLPWQAPGYLVAYAASEGRLFSHHQARLIGLAYIVVVVLGLLLTIPYWRLLGLV